MSRFLAVLGRQPAISLAELESLFTEVTPVSASLAEFESEFPPNIDRLGGSLKIAVKIDQPIVKFLQTLSKSGKITIGVSDFSPRATAYSAQKEALYYKTLLRKSGHSVRVVPNKEPVLSTAASFHNHLTPDKGLELIKYKNHYYRVLGVQNIDAYVRRDQARPARDTKVGMLPPKLAQILINLNGDLPENTRLLDPFCGTGVVLQEAFLAGYTPYGTDINPRMVQYSRKNLAWLKNLESSREKDSKVLRNDSGAPEEYFKGKNVVKNTTVAQNDPQNVVDSTTTSRNIVKNTTISQKGAKNAISGAIDKKSATISQGIEKNATNQPAENVVKITTKAQDSSNKDVVKITTSNPKTEKITPKTAKIPDLTLVEQGDATNFQWQPPIGAVACETYLGPPMSNPPAGIKLKEVKHECGGIILGFLKNLAQQIQPGTPVTIAVPAWLRPSGEYERLNLLDEISHMGYNVKSFRNLGQSDLIYYRAGQIVAREIIVLRKI